MSFRIVMTIATVSLVTTVNCKPSADSSSSSGKGDAVVRNSSEETQVHMGRGVIPAQFPPGMALYPGADFTSTARTAKDVVVSLSSADSVGAIFAFYRKQGYEELSDLHVDDREVLHLKDHGSGKDFQVVVKTTSSGSEVALVAPL